MSTFNNDKYEIRKDLPKRSLEVESVVVDRGWDFVDEEVPSEALSSGPKSAEIYKVINLWCSERGLDIQDMWFYADKLNINIFGWDRPMVFLPQFEVFLLGYNYFFIPAMIVYLSIYSIFPELVLGVQPFIKILVVVSAIYGLWLAREARRRRRKMLLPSWETFALLLKLRQ